MTAFARPFNLHLPDGTLLHGAEYPDGKVVVIPADGGGGGAWVAVSLEALLADRMPDDTNVEWAEELQP